MSNLMCLYVLFLCFLSLSNVLVEIFNQVYFEGKSPRSSKHSLFETKHKPLDRVMDNMQEPKHLRRWSTKSTKGAFYFNENVNAITSNSFALDIQVETSVFFTIETFLTDLHSSNYLGLDKELERILILEF